MSTDSIGDASFRINISVFGWIFYSFAKANVSGYVGTLSCRVPVGETNEWHEVNLFMGTNEDGTPVANILGRDITEAHEQQEAKERELKASAANVDAFIEKARRYRDIQQLTPELLRLFIQRIEVGERSEKYSRHASQEI